MRLPLLVLLAAVAAGCSSAPAAPSTSDARVAKRVGQAPPELGSDLRWLNAPPTTLAALRGRVVYVQFAFPT